MNHPDRCKRIEAMMKTLSPTQLEELFKILQKNKCEYTVNNNGIFLNLSWVEGSILDQMELFIKFCNESKKELDKYEQICRDLGDDLLDNMKKEEAPLLVEGEEEGEEGAGEGEEGNEEGTKKAGPKISSSMRFYLLKKKFSKSTHGHMYQHLKDRQLYKEEYLL